MDIILVAFIRLVESQPNLSEIQLFEEALANIVPLHLGAARTGGAKCRPVRIVQKDLDTPFLGELRRNDVEDNDTRF